MLERVPREKEFDIMLPSTNRNNLKSFKELLPKFFYNTETNKRIINTLNPLTISWKDSYLDRVFDLNSQRRAFYYIPLTAENDDAFKLYKTMLEKKRDEASLYNEHRIFDPNWVNAKARKLIKEVPEILSYDTFVSNKVLLPNKTTAKLFKLLIKQKVITKEESETITTKKQSTKNLYLCISRNPVDYLFSSTNQPFSSCISLNSDYEDAAFMGLGALPVDPNRCIVAVTKGRVKNYTLHNSSFRHLGMVSRSWGIMYSNNQFHLVGIYPHTNLNYQDMVYELYDKIKPVGLHTDTTTDCTSLFNFDPPRYIDGSCATIYMDGGSPLEICNDKFRYNRHHGRTGVWHTFNCGMCFEEIHYFEDLESGGMSCRECGDRYDVDEMFAAFDEYYCEYCFDELFTYCEHCDEVVYRDDSIYVEESFSVCDYCYRHYFEVCEKCDIPFHKDNIMTTADDTTLCDYCYSESTTECDDCGKRYFDDWNIAEINGKLVCDECIENSYFKCEDCNSYVHNYNTCECQREEAVNE